MSSTANAWSEGDARADRRDQLHRWDRLHHGRTALLVAAFALVTAGLTG